MDFAADIADLEPGEFARRQAEARQRGTPAWLWPEVSPGAWFEALADIRQAISRVLAGEPARLASGNVRAMSVACYTAGVGPLLGSWQKSRKLSAEPEIARLLKLHLEQAKAREKRVRAEAKGIVSALTARGIPVIILKGGDSAYRYFEVPEVRPASDFDLLVPFDWSRAAEGVLADHGLACLARGARETSWADPGQSREPRSLWLVHGDDPWSIDLHNSLDFAASPGAARVRLDRAEPFATAENWAVGPPARVLSQPLLLLHLAVHASGGLHSLTMLRMVEIVLVIRRDVASGQLSWDEFLTAGAQAEALGAAYPALKMSEMLAPGTVSVEVLAACAHAALRRVRKIVDQLEPSIAHRVERASVAEHFMWVAGAGGWLRQLWSDVLPNPRSLRRVYGARLYRLLRGQIRR
jgi:hypothetical protein